MQFFKNIFGNRSDEDFFNNAKFVENCKNSENYLPEKVKKLIYKIYNESMKTNLKFEEKAKTLLKKLKACNLPENASKIKPLAHHCFEYQNPQIKEKILELSRKIPFYRAIRGDGNCFYRAIAFSLLEKMILKFWRGCRNHKEPEDYLEIVDFLSSFLGKKNALTQCSLSKTSNQKSYRIMEEILETSDLLLLVFLRQSSNLVMVASQAESFKEVYEKIEREFIENELFDISAVVVIRSILNQILEKNLKMEEYAPFLVSPNELFNILKTFGEEAENIIIPISSDAFNRVIIVNMIHRNASEEGSSIVVEKYQPLIQTSVMKKELEVINLYFRPGHYDLGYENENEIIKVIENI